MTIFRIDSYLEPQQEAGLRRHSCWLVSVALRENGNLYVSFYTPKVRKMIYSCCLCVRTVFVLL